MLDNIDFVWIIVSLFLLAIAIRGTIGALLVYLDFRWRLKLMEKLTKEDKEGPP